MKEQSFMKIANDFKEQSQVVLAKAKKEAKDANAKVAEVENQTQSENDGGKK